MISSALYYDIILSFRKSQIIKMSDHIFSTDTFIYYIIQSGQPSMLTLIFFFSNAFVQILEFLYILGLYFQILDFFSTYLRSILCRNKNRHFLLEIIWWIFLKNILMFII